MEKVLKTSNDGVVVYVAPTKVRLHPTTYSVCMTVVFLSIILKQFGVTCYINLVGVYIYIFIIRD